MLELDLPRDAVVIKSAFAATGVRIGAVMTPADGVAKMGTEIAGEDWLAKPAKTAVATAVFAADEEAAAAGAPAPRLPLVFFSASRCCPCRYQICDVLRRFFKIWLRDGAVVAGADRAGIWRRYSSW